MHRPLFFRRLNRWRVNAEEFALPFTKKGLFRGYFKYGVFIYATYWYTIGKPVEPHGHHGDEHGHH